MLLDDTMKMKVSFLFGLMFNIIFDKCSALRPPANDSSLAFVYVPLSDKDDKGLSQQHPAAPHAMHNGHAQPDVPGTGVDDPRESSTAANAAALAPDGKDTPTPTPTPARPLPSRGHYYPRHPRYIGAGVVERWFGASRRRRGLPITDKEDHMTDVQPPHEPDHPMAHMNAVEANQLATAPGALVCPHCRVEKRMLPLTGAGCGVEVFHQPGCPEHEPPTPERPGQPEQP